MNDIFLQINLVPSSSWDSIISSSRSLVAFISTSLASLSLLEPYPINPLAPMEPSPITNIPPTLSTNSNFMITSAINGILREKVYMEQPPRFEYEDKHLVRNKFLGQG